MITVTKSGLLSRTFEIAQDGRPLTEWTPRFWRKGGEVELDGRSYEIGSSLFGGTYGMADAAGAEVARAERSGLGRWSIAADGTTYEFKGGWGLKRTSTITADGVQVGEVRSTAFSMNLEADMPDVPLPTQLFIVLLVLTQRQRQASSGAGAAAATGV